MLKKNLKFKFFYKILDLYREQKKKIGPIPISLFNITIGQFPHEQTEIFGSTLIIAKF